MIRPLRGALGALLILTATSCGGDSPTQPVAPIAVQVTVTPSNLVPGKTVQVVVTATPPSGETVSLVKFAISGAFTYSDSISSATQGSVTMSRYITLPLLTGNISILATAQGTGGSTGTNQTSMAIADAVPPTFTAVATPSASPGIVQAGDTVKIAMQAFDDVSMSYLVLRSTGAISLTDSTAVVVLPSAGMNRNVNIIIPASAALNSTFALTAEAKDVGGNLVRKDLGTYTIRDVLAPSITASVGNARANGAFAPGDTATIVLAATDNRSLRSYGFVLSGGVADSVSAAGKTAQRTVRVPLPNAGTYALTLFATDSAGNRTQVPGGVITVDSRTRRPVMSLPLGGGYDIAWDQKRSRIYVSQPDSLRVAVVAADGSSRLPSMSVTSGRPFGIDVTNGGDSLVIALRGTLTLGFLDLNSGAIGTNTVITDQFMNRTPMNVRVAANNRVIFTVTFDGSGYGGSLSEFNLATGLVGKSVIATESVPLASTGNRQRVFGLIDDSCCPEGAHYYDASTASFSVSKGVVSSYFPGIATDFAGTYFLAGMNYLTGDLAPLRTLIVSNALKNPVALSNDGSFAYFGTSTGYVKIRTSDNAELERVSLGHAPTHFRMLPDGLTLVATSATTVDVIDLW